MPSNLGHRGSSLSIKRTMSVDSNTAFLAHYDVTEEESLYGIEPLGYNKSFLFEGSSYFDTPISTNGMSTITMETWAYLSTGSPAMCLIGSFEGGGAGIEYSVVSASKINFGVYVGGSYKHAVSDSAIPLEKWVHIAGVYDGANVILYIDGVRQSTSPTATGTIGNSSYKLSIGCNPPASSMYRGRLSDVRVWSTSRSEKDIQQNMNRNLIGDESGLIALWKLNEGTGSIVRDYCDQSRNIWATGPSKWTYGRTVTSIRQYDGKYGGALAIEEPTSNVVNTSSSIVNYGDGSVTQELVTTGFFTGWYKVTINTQNTTNSLLCYQSGITTNTGKTYSFSIDFFSPTGNIFPQINGSTGVGACVQESPYRWTKTWTNSTGVDKNEHWYFQRIPSVVTGEYFYWRNKQIELKPYCTSFVEDIREDGGIKYPKDGVLNYVEGTINYWIKLPYALPYIPTVYYDGVLSTSPTGLYGATSSLSLARYKNDYADRIVGIHWHSTDGTANHSNITTAQAPMYANNAWNMFTITWNTSSYNFYINGIRVKSVNAGGSGVLKDFEGDLYFGPNQMIDELRIDRVRRTDDEIESWFLSQSPFFPKGVHRVYF